MSRIHHKKIKWSYRGTFVLILIILLATAAVTGCKPQPEPTATPTKTPTEAPVLVTPTPLPTSTPPPATATPTPTIEAETPTPLPTETPTEQAGPELIVMGNDINPLTGLKTDPAKLNRRPLAVKIPNYPDDARPQSGLNAVDVMLEYETEANISRFTAIYYGEDAGLIGPIRSMRLPDSEVVPIFKSALVASGGHPAVKIRATEGKAWAEGYKRIVCPEEPFLGDGGVLRRIPNKKPRYELTLYSDTASMWSVLDERGINERPDFNDMFVFSEQPPMGGREAMTLTIVYKRDFSEIQYQYDAETQSYKRFDFGEPLIDELDGEQVAPQNVLVLYANHVDTDIPADAHDPNNIYYAVSIQLWGQGPAKLLRDGQVFDVTWIRENPQKDTDRLILVDGEGNQVPFHIGKTWIQVVRLDGNVVIE